MSKTDSRPARRGLFRRFRRDQRGATAIEYALIAVGIAVAVVATVKGSGSSLNTNFYSKINAATSN